MDEKGLGGVTFLLIIIVIWMWFSMNNLKDKISACAWQIETANISINDANNEIVNAKSKAWGNYNDMGHALANLGGEYASRENPCDKDFSGDLNNLPKQE